jgi:hypothetical protein
MNPQVVREILGTSSVSSPPEERKKERKNLFLTNVSCKLILEVMAA